MARKNYLHTFIYCAVWLCSNYTIWGQINITFPTSRIVFQRDNAGNGVVPITGQFTQSIDKVEARLVPINGGQQTNWQTVQQNPQGGFYSGTISGRGGWYGLEVRGLSNGNEVAFNEIQRIGIGEVFMIAGQSNAQGFFNYGAPGSNDDRVNCVNYQNVSDQNGSFPQPNYVKLNDNSTLGPRGLSAWYWGRLGDLLASRLNVPILFYNAAWEGTASKNWAETVDGGTTGSIYVNANYASGQPYGNLKLALNYYAATTGLRAVLWQQGEADNQLNTAASTYASNLQRVISKSREHYGRNVAWVIARTSYYNAKNANQNIIDGQNQVISSTPAVFGGPFTDGIQVPRPDGYHFQNNGLIDAANAWNGVLDEGFFINSSPQTGNYPGFTISCVGGNQLNISIQGPFASVQWSNGLSGAANFGPGTYQGQVRDGSGNVYFTPAITIPNDLQSSPVNIAVEGKLPLCVGSSVTLVSSNASGNNWNTGANSQRIEVTTAGTYTVATKNSYGCNTSTSINVATFQGVPPAKPTITASGPTTFCQGGEVGLTASGAAEYRWSTGERGQSVMARNSGNYQVRVLDAQGCISEPNSISVQVNMPPSAPSITASGNTTFCEGGNVTLSSNYTSGNIWSNQAQTNDISVTKSGTYNVRFRDSNGCDAISNNITVTVNPLPSTPVITRERPAVFCDGDFTVLTSSPSAQYAWSNGERSRRLTTSSAGNFSLRVTDANGCVSAVSETVNVVVNSLPQAPVITAERTPNICENEVITLTSNSQSGYIWSNGQNTRSITVNLPGRYSARTVDANQCFSPSSNVISLTVNTLPLKPTITAQGPTTFCQGERVVLQTNYSTGLTWSNFQTTQNITASAGGEYRVRHRDANGCESVSDPLLLTVNQLPAAPTVVNERPTTFCLFDNTILTITSGGNIFSWNNGLQGRSIKLFSAGDISATVFEPSTGCTSLPSTPIKVTVNPLPPKPSITVTGPTTICADQSVTLSAPLSGAYQWSNQGTTRDISVNRTGNYTVVVRNQFGCPSEESDAISIRVNPLPPAPTVIAEGRTTFCDGDQVGLRVESPNSVIWNTNETTKRIIAKQSGNYAARVRDDLGCLSPFSSTVRVDARPLPINPLIQKIGVYTLEIANPVPLATYDWQLNNTAFATNKPFIKANKSGDYTAQASIQYSPALTCFSKPSVALVFVLETENNGLGIYPNPSRDGKITIETLEDLKDATLVVYDERGVPVYTTLIPLLNVQKRFDFSSLPPGNYIIRVANNQYRQNKKITINP